MSPGVLTMVLLLVLPNTEALLTLQTKRWNSSLGTLVNHILDHHFPPCGLILLQDKYFASNMNTWLLNFPHPYYSLTLDGKPFPDYTTWKGVTKTTGFSCSTIIAVCLSFKTCRNNDSETLFTMLYANGILLKDKRTLMYVDEETDQDPHFSDGSRNSSGPVKFSFRPVTYQEQDVQEYTIPALNMAKRAVEELQSHITIIRKINPKRDPLSVDENLHKTVFLETTTFSPNWIPGGTPVLKNIWSSKQGFLFTSAVKLSLNHIRPGGTARFCTTSKDVLPMFSYNQGNFRGVGGQMMKIFQQRFGFRIQVFEPSDNEYGQKGTNGWNGVIGYVYRKEADFGIGQITLTLDRFASGLKFTQAFIVLTAVAVCPRPRLLPRFRTLIQPFDPYCWLALGVTTVAVVTVMQIMQACVRKFNIKVRTPGRGRNGVSWIHVLGPITQRSVTLMRLPRRWEILGLMSLWLTGALVLSAAYVSLLIGALTVPAREAHVTSPYDLIRRNIPFVTAPIVRQAINKSILPEEQLLARRSRPVGYQRRGPVKDFDFIQQTGSCAVAERLRSNYLVGLSQSSANESLLGRPSKRNTSSRLYVSRDAILIGPMGWAMRADMDFLLENYFDRALLQFRAQGLLAKTMQDFNQWASTGREDNREDFKPLALETVEPVFVSAAICMLLSFVSFVCELVAHKRARRLTMDKPGQTDLIFLP